MEYALKQASTMRRIRQMKRTMTPRLPPLHNRTLTGNILDASLGVMNTPEPPHPQQPRPLHVNQEPPHPCPPYVNQVITTTASVPMETTTSAEEHASRDQQSGPEIGQRSVVEGACGHDKESTKSLNVQDSTEDKEEPSKTYANVRLSTDSIPLRLSSSDETLPPVINTNIVRGDNIGVNAAGVLPPEILMKDDVGTNIEQFSAIGSPSLQLPSATTVDSHSLSVSGHPLPVDMSIEDSPFEATPLPLSPTVGNVLGEGSASPQRDLNSTYTKSSSTTSTREIHQQAMHTAAYQQDEVRTRNEHSYAMVEPANGDRPLQREEEGEKSSLVSNMNQVNEDQTSRGTPSLQAVPSHEQVVIGEAGTRQSIFIANEERNLKESGENSQPLVVEEKLDGYVDHSSTIMDLVEAGDSRMSIVNLVPAPEEAMEVLHEPMTLLPTVIEDQVLEVAVIEPKSDIPMPVEYTVVTQQDEPPPPSPPQKEEKPAEEDVPIQNPDAEMVLEDGNESGESITIGCEVTTSTMELTDVTDFSGGSSTVATTERQSSDFAVAEDISCETVIITTSAMNSSSAGYSTPSEDSDGTMNSVEEKRNMGMGQGGRERGEGGGERERGATTEDREREKKISEIIANHDDGTESDVAFEDILKQIESAPYELRISNIVLAQLSRAASKSPPNLGKKRKRRSAVKKWTRTKSRKSNTPRKQ